MKIRYLSILGILIALGAFTAFDLSAAEQGGVCNGGQCTAVGKQTYSCPTTGGPTCADGERCVCECSVVDGKVTPSNTCWKSTEMFEGAETGVRVPLEKMN